MTIGLIGSSMLSTSFAQADTVMVEDNIKIVEISQNVLDETSSVTLVESTQIGASSQIILSKNQLENVPDFKLHIDPGQSFGAQLNYVIAKVDNINATGKKASLQTMRILQILHLNFAHYQLLDPGWIQSNKLS